MSYGCADFQETIFSAFQDAGLISAGADPQNLAETADLVLAGLHKLQTQHAEMLAALRAVNDAYSFISESVPAPLLHAIRKARRAIARATGAT